MVWGQHIYLGTALGQLYIYGTVKLPSLLLYEQYRFEISMAPLFWTSQWHVTMNSSKVQLADVRPLNHGFHFPAHFARIFKS